MDSVDSLFFQIGERIRTRRERANLTQEDLARKVGLTRTSITNIEKGQQRVQVHTLYIIADFLNTSIYNLLPPGGRDQVSGISQLMPKDILPQEREWVADIMSLNGKTTKKSGQALDIDSKITPADFLKKARVKEPPVPIEHIVKQYGVDVRYLPFKGQIAGLAYNSPSMMIIGINANQEKARQRFVIAHELGHLVQFIKDKSTEPKLQVDRSISATRYIDVDKHAYAREVAANDFASRLLIPFGMLKDDLGNKKIEPEESEVLDHLAARYDVPLPAMYYRLVGRTHLKFRK
jgi:transcriptional regulator with XRE-family HTH domain